MIFAAIFLSLLRPSYGSSDDQMKKFESLLTTRPEKIWSKTISEKLRTAIQAYNSRLKLPNGLNYGDSVRRYDLQGKCLPRIESEMKKMGCREQLDKIRDPKTNKPIEIKSHRTTPIYQFVCPDGGVVKVKPEGDPTNSYTPFPHASRALRAPGQENYRDYRDEVAKVGRKGHIIPKDTKDLAEKKLIQGWSKEAHVPLPHCH